jgi:phosphoribosylanthranilate isomerase
VADLPVLQGRNWLLAGGLDAANVGQASAAAHAWGVDVSSGVEASRGVKDPAKIRAFVHAAKSAATV